jgi:hypothetical protein
MEHLEVCRWYHSNGEIFNMLEIRSAIMEVSNDFLISVENANFIRNCARRLEMGLEINFTKLKRD